MPFLEGFAIGVVWGTLALGCGFYGLLPFAGKAIATRLVGFGSIVIGGLFLLFALMVRFGELSGSKEVLPPTQQRLSHEQLGFMGFLAGFGGLLILAAYLMLIRRSAAPRE